MTRPARPARVAIVEDDEVILGDLVARVSAVEQFELAGTATTLKAALALVASAPDVFLVDLGLPDGSGFELITQVCMTQPTCKTVVISVFGDVTNVVRAIELGADGYLLKGADLEQTAASIRTVLDGGAPLSPAVASHILRKMRGPARPAHKQPAVGLTAREAMLLESLAKGLTFKEVAAIHGISHQTVGDHVKAIYKKLSVNSRGEAIFEAVQTGLIRLGQ